jgi:hypothetical protein
MKEGGEGASYWAFGSFLLAVDCSEQFVSRHDYIIPME